MSASRCDWRGGCWGDKGCFNRFGGLMNQLSYHTTGCWGRIGSVTSQENSRLGAIMSAVTILQLNGNTPVFWKVVVISLGSRALQ